MKAFRLVVVVVAVVVVGLLGCFGYRLANSTDTYTYRGAFTTLPASDDAFRDWLVAQPGVTGGSVTRDGQAVVIEYTMPMHGSDPRPAPVKEAERLGYGGLQGYTGGYKSRW